MPEKTKFNILEFVKHTPVPRICIIGNTRSGKTVLARKIITKYAAWKKRILICDTKFEFDDVATMKKSEFMESRSIIRKLRSIGLGGEVIEDPKRIAEFISSLAWNYAPSIVYLEEVAEFISKSDSLPVSHPLIYKVLQQGASRGCGIIVVTQMFRDLHESFLRQCTDCFIFALDSAECRIAEQKFGLKAGTIKFDLPTKSERKAGNIKDLYSFYHREPSTTPTFHAPIEHSGKKGRYKGKISEGVIIQ